MNNRSGVRKNHGPKRHLFHEYNDTERLTLARADLLSKYCDKDAWLMSCLARGAKWSEEQIDKKWTEFTHLQFGKTPLRVVQNAWFANIGNSNKSQTKNTKTLD